MGNDLLLRRKLTLKSGERKLVLQKKPIERTEHVLMKAFLWHLYLPTYPELLVEYSIGDRYKPDVIMLDPAGDPLFWGEAGSVNTSKIESLVRRYPRTHFAIAKWGIRIDPYVEIVRSIVEARPRPPFPRIDILAIPHDADQRFIEADGRLTIAHNQIEWVRIEREV